MEDICCLLLNSIQRVKGCTKIGKQESHTYLERTSDGSVKIRPFYRVPTTGTKLLAVGSESTPENLKKALKMSLNSKE